MKKTLSVLIVLMIVSSVVFARRIDNPGVAVRTAVVKSGTTFKLYYKGTEQNDVKVSILDAGRNVVFSETLRKVGGFVRPYNFSNLPEGDYSIEIADKNGRHSEKVSYEIPNLEKLAHLRKVSGGEEKYLLTVSNKEANDLTVKIFDASNTMIYDHTEEIDSDFARVYNLERFSGRFTFEITDGNGVTKSLSY